MKPPLPGMIRLSLRALGLAIVPCVPLASGCIDAGTRQQMAEGNSILAPIFNAQPTPTDAVTWASDEYDADKRARGTSLLLASPFGGEEPYLALYRKYVTDPNTNVRAVAARALGQHGAPEDVPLITPLLSDKERIVRQEAVHALQRLHNPAAAPALIERLVGTRNVNPEDPRSERIPLEPEPSIRADAATALGQYASTSVLQALIGALADDSFAVNLAAQSSLQTLTGRTDIPDDRNAWIAWLKESERPFEHRQVFVYPAFSRDKRWLDYLPFMRPSPNEVAASPAGFPTLQTSAAPSPESEAP